MVFRDTFWLVTLRGELDLLRLARNVGLVKSTRESLRGESHEHLARCADLLDKVTFDKHIIIRKEDLYLNNYILAPYYIYTKSIIL